MKTAHSVMVMFCDGCDAAHLVLYDEEDRPFAQAVIDDDIMASLHARCCAQWNGIQRNERQ